MKINIKSQLNKKETMIRLTKLLNDRSVKFNSNEDTIESTSTPFCIINFDRRMYSKNNWFGINPFQFISKITIAIEEKEQNTNILVIASPYRAIGWIAFWWLLALPIIQVNLLAGLITLAVALIVSLTIWFIFLQRLIPAEIRNAIKTI